MIPRNAQAAGHLPTASLPRERQTQPFGRLARRHIVVTLTKFLLPFGAIALLATIALWPEFKRSNDPTRFSLSHVSGQVEGARLKNARYHGIDDKGRPYTLTAGTVRQLDPERVALTQPKADVTEANGSWLMLRADDGLFAQRANSLDLSRNVMLYRDDGTTLTTASATLDMKNGAAAGAQPVHAEGPFGTLDAQGFTITDKGTSIEFAGPARVILNGAAP